jgi:(E)-4-hydroxy-3-methylbut-2-enyl-diphosphate synthase
VDVIRVASDAQAALEARNIPLQVAVMGCVVNGPGEAREADLGIAAGRGKGHLFVRGKVVRVVPENEMVDALIAEAEAIVRDGIEARLEAADENAEAIAAATRDELLQIQGTDANKSSERVDRIRDIAG